MHKGDFGITLLLGSTKTNTSAINKHKHAEKPRLFASHLVISKCNMSNLSQPGIHWLFSAVGAASSV